MPRFAALLLALLLTGCARYEYDVLQPSQVASHIARNTDSSIRLDPLEYRMRTVDDRLVVRIFNPAEVPVQLVGDRSYVVDPNGQSHDLPSQTIAPASFIKFVFPPLRPQYRQNPNIGFGIGIGISNASPIRRTTGAGAASAPLYLMQAPPDQYWDWKGETQIRLHFAFVREGEAFAHDLVLRRSKVK